MKLEQLNYLILSLITEVQKLQVLNQKVSFSLNGGTPVEVGPDANGNYVLNLLDLGNKGNLKGY